MYLVSRMYGVFQTAFYFGYMALFSISLGIMCGKNSGYVVCISIRNEANGGVVDKLSSFQSDCHNLLKEFVDQSLQPQTIGLIDVVARTIITS